MYEDEDLLVLNKRSGVPSIPLRTEETETAVSSALAHDPGLAGLGRGGLEPGILHRLDTQTSGLLAFARNKKAYQWLHIAWKERRIRKFYRAICAPAPTFNTPKLPHLIDTPLGHDAKSSRRMRLAQTEQELRRIRGKALEARTRLLGFETLPGPPKLAQVRVEIETGVMHQIRVHLASIGLPLLGDTLYKGPESESERFWLHAEILELPLPGGVSLTLRSTLPPNWPGTQGT